MPSVWMINHYAITPDLPGGTRHYDFACELSRLGCQTSIFASDINLAIRKHCKLIKDELFQVEKIDNVKFVWVRAAIYQKNNWRRFWNMISFSYNTVKVSSQIDENPEVIIGSSPHPFAALAAYQIAKRKNAKFFLELRDLWPQALIDMGGLSEYHPATILMRKLEGYLYLRAEKIIVLAEGSTDYLVKRWKVPREKIVYLPNGVHMENFTCNMDRECLRQKYGFNKQTLIYTGAHGPANSLDTVIDAAVLLREREEIEIILVGDGPLKKDLVNKVEYLGLKNIRFIDPIPKSEIPGILKAADIALISLQAADAFSYAISPNKLFDYMAARKPVICSVAGNVGELVMSSNVGITVKPENPRLLADAILEMNNKSKAELQHMGDNGYHVVNKDYSRQSIAERLFTVLNF